MVCLEHQVDTGLADVRRSWVAAYGRLKALSNRRSAQALAEQEVLDKLTTLGGAAARRCIESHLYFRESSTSPRLFTRATQALILRGALRVRPLPGSYSEDSQILHLPNTISKRIDRCEQRLLEAQDVLAPAPLGAAGEDYARGILFRSEQFAGIPRRRSRIASAPFDLLAHLKSDRAIRYIIEVKNRREVFYPGSRGAKFFGKLAKAAIEADRYPLLIVSYLSDEAIAACRRLGIAVIVMRRQIIPNSISMKQRRLLKAAFGPDPYEKIEPNRALHHKKGGKSAADIAYLQNARDLEFSRKRWDQTRSVLPRQLRKPPGAELSLLTLAGIERILRR